jgi:hypothetical protein
VGASAQDLASLAELRSEALLAELRSEALPVAQSLYGLQDDRSVARLTEPVVTTTVHEGKFLATNRAIYKMASRPDAR